MCSKSRLKSVTSPLPVDVRRSKTSLLKLSKLTYLILGEHSYKPFCHCSSLRQTRPPSYGDLFLSAIRSYQAKKDNKDVLFSALLCVESDMTETNVLQGPVPRKMVEFNPRLSQI